MKKQSASVRMLMAREVTYTQLRVEDCAIRDGWSNKPTTAHLIAYSFDRLDRFQDTGKHVDFLAISKMAATDLEIPSWLDCGLRFQTDVCLSANLAARLDAFLRQLSEDFRGVQRVYRNFAVRLLYRFVILDELGKVPLKEL